MAYTRAFSITRPDGALVNASQIDDEIRYAREDTRERLAAFFEDVDVDPPVMKAQASVRVSATGKVRLDGSLTGDTYWTESSANVADLYAGGINAIRATATVTTITPALTVAFDGSNKLDITVSATGAVTLNATGASAGFTFQDAVAVTALTHTLDVVSTTNMATGSALAATTSRLFANTGNGATLMGFGTTYDVSIKNRAGNDVFGVTANTVNCVFQGGITATTGTFSGATSTTTLTASTSVVIGSITALSLNSGDLQIGNNGTTIYLGLNETTAWVGPNSANVKIGGTSTDVSILGDHLGFFNTSPVVKPTVTGSRGANAALASLLTSLSGLGLLTDSSS